MLMILVVIEQLRTAMMAKGSNLLTYLFQSENKLMIANHP